ncbi:hypothetical protein J31TS4_19560 [Paenibacillus sp. J31TS4]|uniref:serine hydrolase domain-containing protein n=1 Tax=Paenibacillus sp. J31TS4 TaxID=2807195 RepID=UPI001B164A01|nr:serine hydrolase domain-containing protein [Paenibacillus sp. J31TS4]GIP38676.1 hypothetical protein J31TS4_19560 [Paenibacillus sp. J31TS4]
MEPTTTSVLERALAAYAAQGYLQGAVLVGKGPDILLRRGYGHASEEHAVPNRPDTPFRIASLSKAFTAQAILLLREEGRLALDDTACRHLPSFPYREITIRQLLTHTAGLGDLTFSLEYWRVHQRVYHPPGELLELQLKQPRAARPGTFRYSNFGYMVLGLIVKACSDLSFGDFLRSRLFDPLGMIRTGHDDGRTVIPEAAAGYSIHRELVRAEHADAANGFGGFSLYATADDLHRWSACVLEGVRSSDGRTGTVTAAATGERGASGGTGESPSIRTVLASSDACAFGWARRRILLGGAERTVLSLTGDVSGFRAQLLLLPEEAVHVIVLSNRNLTPVEAIARRIAGHLFGEPFQAEERQALPEPPLSSPAGVYLPETVGTTTGAFPADADAETAFLARLAGLSAGEVSDGRFYPLFEEAGFDPAGMLAVFEEDGRSYLFQQIGYSWYVLPLVLVRQTEREAEYATGYVDGSLTLRREKHGTARTAVYQGPDGSQRTAFRRSGI